MPDLVYAGALRSFGASHRRRSSSPWAGAQPRTSCRSSGSAAPKLPSTRARPSASTAQTASVLACVSTPIASTSPASSGCLRWARRADNHACGATSSYQVTPAGSANAEGHSK